MQCVCGVGWGVGSGSGLSEFSDKKVVMTEVLSDMLVPIYHRYNFVYFDHVLFISNLM